MKYSCSIFETSNQIINLKYRIMINNAADKDRADEFAAMLECIQDMDKKKLDILEAGLKLCKNKNEEFSFQQGIDSTNASIRFFESSRKIFEGVAVY